MKPGRRFKFSPVGIRWLVSWRSGSEQCSFDAKEAAVAFAKEGAKKLQPCTLTVLDRQGDTEYELNY